MRSSAPAVLRRQRGGGPIIKPHVSLLSGIETTHESAEQKLKRLAVRLDHFTVKLRDWLAARVLPLSVRHRGVER